jgi:DNA topoisomerase VI subunit B
MSTTSKRLIDQLEQIAKERDRQLLVEKQANYVVSSLINFLGDVGKTLSESEVKLLENKLMLSIRARDPDKLIACVRKMYVKRNK